VLFYIVVGKGQQQFKDTSLIGRLKEETR